jgi:cyanophycin synthetase
MPLVAIAGSRGKTTVAWMIQEIAEEQGWSTGSWLSSGVYVDGVAQPGELAPWKRVVTAARLGELDLVLQEMAASTVVGAGLPAQSYPAAIITTICGNDDHCRFSPETARELRALNVLAGAIQPDGLIVGNADDVLVADFVDEHPAESVLFALRRENPVLQNHLDRGGRGAWVERGWLCFGTASNATRVVQTRHIPATLDGALLLQVQNALAAMAFALCAGAAPKAVATALKRYIPSPERQPGSCNVYARNGARVLVDSHVRLWSMRMLLRGIRRWRHRRIVVATGCFPELDRADAREAGVMLSSVASVVMLHAGAERQARVNEIRSGVVSSASAAVVLVRGSEPEALAWLLDNLGRDDIGLVISEQPAETHKLLTSAGLHIATEPAAYDAAAN